MTQDLLQDLLAGRLADPDGGATLAVPTRSVVLADSLEGRESELIAGLDMGSRLAVIYDDNTHKILGQRVQRALSRIADLIEIHLPGRPHADEATTEAIRDAAAASHGLVAVGAGTINDLCKYAAALDGKPYAVFATAPSMNGYTSVNAAITVKGHKKSLAAAAPRGVFVDLTVLSQAPPRMIRSGLGDSLCRPTAQTDWLLAHLLFDQPYREAPFMLLADDEEDLFDRAGGLLKGDLAAMHSLARTLILSGFGMTLCGGSYPASQGEHLISHYIEMLAPRHWPESFHGEQIGVTTLSMVRLQERLLDGPAPRLAPGRTDEASIMAHFGEELGPACWAEFRHKRLDAERSDALNARLAETWDAMRERFDAVRLSARRLEEVLCAAGAPTRPRELGWDDSFYAEALRHAREIRNRYTFLDLAVDSGQFETFIRR